MIKIIILLILLSTNNVQANILSRFKDYFSSLLYDLVSQISSVFSNFPSSSIEGTEIYLIVLKKFGNLNKVLKKAKEMNIDEVGIDHSEELYNSLKSIIYDTFYHKYNDTSVQPLDNFNFTVNNYQLFDSNFTDTFIGNTTNDYDNPNYVKYGIEQFVKGVFEGISRSYYFEDNKCFFKDIQPYISEIAKKAISVKEAFNSRTGLIKSLFDLYYYLQDLNSLGSNCNFQELTLQLYTFSFKLGEARFTHRLINNRFKIAQYYEIFINNIVSVEKYKTAGIAFGNILKILCKHSTR